MPPVTQLRGGRRGSIGGYPHQWFDLSSTYIPPTVKEMFRWCHYLYSSHSEIAPIVNKKCSYVITQLIYDTEREKTKRMWRELLEKTLKIREMEFKLLLDYEIYGNAYCSIFYPFERYLRCKKCDHVQLARKSEWVYRDFAFHAQCQECGHKGVMEPKDKVIRSRPRVKLIRWNPQYVDIRYNPLTDRSEYIYRIPKWVRQRVQNRKANKILVEDTPLEFLEAIKGKKNLKFDDSNIYHFKNPSASGEDDAYGMPPMMPVFKDAWLFQTYKRAQEAIALEHVLPLTLLIPAATATGISPHQNTNLAEWSRKMMDIVHRWRRDQNSIYTVPFPVTVENVRGDAGALNVHNEMNQVRQQIAGGLDVPQEFIYGGLNWSGSSISLRVLENLFLNRIEQLDGFLQDFVIPKLQRFFSMPAIDIRHRDFKMADDAQQKQIALGLRQTNTISDRTTIEELGFDGELETRRKKEEAVERDAALIQQMRAQAEAQGLALQTQTRYQLKAQQSQQQDLGNMQAQAAGMAKSAAASGAPATPVELPKLELSNNPQLLDMMAHRFLKGPGSPEDKRLELMQIEQTNQALARAIKERMRTIREQGNDKFLRPLPEQRPPRRESSPV